MRSLLLTLLLATPAMADSPEAWEEWRAEVDAACRALVTDPGGIEIEVNPFGSEHYGVAIITLTTQAGSDRMVCIFDKASKEAELTAAFAVPA